MGLVGDVTPNRTIVELKLTKTAARLLWMWTPNRTIVELKLKGLDLLSLTDDPQSNHSGIEIFYEK